ncbi:MAG: ribonuclease III [Endomicrobiales bacterium]|nr:ribonuclease III [Endomicrobiales bacterium]
MTNELDVDKIKKALDYEFRNKDLLQKAFTHKSYAAEKGLPFSNERMEFLGDSVLSAVVADFLYLKHPSQDEGKLSQFKSQIVSRQNLAKWAKKLKLGQYFLISKGEEINGGRKRDSLLSNTLEAVIAAIYLDSGYDSARAFILAYLEQQKRIVINDPKSKLQEQIQLKYQTLPEYRVLNESGPDHEKIFEIGVYLKRKLLAKGSGRSKKDAQQVAAKRALKEID